MQVVVERRARVYQAQTNTLQQRAREPALLPRQCRAHRGRLLVHQLQHLVLVLLLVDHEHLARGAASRSALHLLELSRGDVRHTALHRVEDHDIHGEVHAHRQRRRGDDHANRLLANARFEELSDVERQSRVVEAHATRHGGNQPLAARGQTLQLLSVTRHCHHALPPELNAHWKDWGHSSHPARLAQRTPRPRSPAAHSPCARSRSSSGRRESPACSGSPRGCTGPEPSAACSVSRGKAPP